MHINKFAHAVLWKISVICLFFWKVCHSYFSNRTGKYTANCIYFVLNTSFLVSISHVCTRFLKLDRLSCLKHSSCCTSCNNIEKILLLSAEYIRIYTYVFYIIPKINSHYFRKPVNRLIFVTK